MTIHLDKELSEMLHFMSKFHGVELPFLVDQLLLNEVRSLIGDAKSRSAKRQVTYFEDNEYPCAVDDDVSDYYQYFIEAKKNQEAFANWDPSTEMQELSKGFEELVHAKPIVIDFFNEITA